MKKLFSYYHKSKEVLKNDGFVVLLRKVFNKIKIMTYATNKATWFNRSLDETITEVNIPYVKILIAKGSEFETWLQQHQSKFPWINVEQEVLATRHDIKMVFVAKVDNEIVGFLRVTVKNAYILDYDSHISLPNDVAFIQDTFVLPEYRQRGIAKCMISNAMIYFKRNGYRNIFCHIPKWNLASKRTYTSLGFKAYADIRFLRIFKWKIYTRNPEKLVRAVQ